MKKLTFAFLFPVLFLFSACGSAGSCSPSAGVYTATCATATPGVAGATTGNSADTSSYYNGYGNTNSAYNSGANSGYNPGYNSGYDTSGVDPSNLGSNSGY